MPNVQANGIDIEYESFGRFSDPAILLIMGVTATMVYWPDSLCQGLAAKGFRVVRFDNRDIGRSTHLDALGGPDLGALIAKASSGRPVKAPYALDDMAADAVGLLDALGIDRAHIVGASMGGMIAQLIAIDHPARTRSLVSIMSTTGRPEASTPKPEAFAALITPPKSPSREDRIARGVAVWRVIGSPGYPTSDEEVTAFVTRGVDYAPYDPEGIGRQLAAVIAAPPRNERLRSVTAPTLVIHGDADPLIPVSGGEDTAQSIPGAELLVISGAGHDIFESLVPTYVKAIGDFAAKVDAKETASA
ncbi:MAG TPA: alpha/beta hydrolase [Roseiarcus sp.]|nr:alpha/beta hydrolase [Roseiarcus sp.]